jgi:hypothetical protein
MKARGRVIGALGLWIIVAGILGLGETANVWNAWIVGVIVAVEGFSIAADARINGLVAGILGLWLIVSSFIPTLRVGPGVRYDDFFVGVVLAFAGFLTPGRDVESHGETRRAA